MCGTRHVAPASRRLSWRRLASAVECAGKMPARQPARCRRYEQNLARPIRLIFLLLCVCSVAHAGQVAYNLAGDYYVDAPQPGRGWYYGYASVSTGTLATIPTDGRTTAGLMVWDLYPEWGTWRWERPRENGEDTWVWIANHAQGAPNDPLPYVELQEGATTRTTWARVEWVSPEADGSSATVSGTLEAASWAGAPAMTAVVLLNGAELWRGAALAHGQSETFSVDLPALNGGDTITFTETRPAGEWRALRWRNDVTISVQTEGPDAQVVVDTTDLRGDINPMVMGFNLSYYHDTDELWADGKIAGYLRDIGTGLLRYPGGEETSNFHWDFPGAPGYHDVWETDPAEWRYTDPEEAATNEAFMNTDEYIAACRTIGAEPLLGVNIESGVRHDRVQDSVDEAVRWVRYCVDKQYDVTYWYLDNECYHEGNYRMTMDEYATYIPMFSQAMKAVDPSIKIVVNWRSEPDHGEWGELLRRVGEHFDVADAHFYWDWGRTNWERWVNENPMTSTNQWSEGGTYTEEIRAFNERAAALGRGHVKLATLEWNLAPNDAGDHPNGFQYALMQSEMMEQFIHGGVEMACLWPLNWAVGDGPFRSILDQTNFEPTPAYFARELYAPAMGGKLVGSTTSLAKLRPLAATSVDGSTLWIYLLHKSGEGVELDAEAMFGDFAAGSASARTLTADNLAGDGAGLRALPVELLSDPGRVRLRLPPHSLTLVTLAPSSSSGVSLNMY